MFKSPVRFLFHDRHTLHTIASHAQLTLSQSEYDSQYRKRAIEELLFYKTDRVTKEVLYDIYGKFSPLMDELERKLQHMVKQEIIMRLQNKRSIFFKKSGYLKWYARRFLIEDMYFLPKPFYKKIQNRLKYLHLNQVAMQDDYRKLHQIVGTLRDKGYVLEGNESALYRFIKIEDIVTAYQELRHHPNYFQKLLEQFDVITPSYCKADHSNSVHSLSNERKIARLKKSFMNSLNQHTWNLEPEKKREFCHILIEHDMDYRQGVRFIKYLAELLSVKPYQEARDEIIRSAQFRELPDKTQSQYEINDQGHLTTQSNNQDS